MDKPVEMLQDQRSILSVSWEGDPATGNPATYSVGDYNGVTRIECYGEPSHYCARPFIALYRGEEVWRRIDATGAWITYATPSGEPR